MSATRGVEAMARILAQLAGGTGIAAAQLAETTALPRSSVFDIVRRLAAAGLVSRQPGGRLVPGPAAVRLGLAAHGLAPLQGPAEALLRLLRDETGGTATLSASGVDLLCFSARGPRTTDTASLTATVADGTTLTLALKSGTTRAARSDAEALLLQVALTLDKILAETTT